MIILGNIFIILSLFILTSQVIVWGGLLLAPLSGIVKGHAIWPEKDEPSLQAKKKKIKSMFRQHHNLHLEAACSKYMF